MSAQNPNQKLASVMSDAGMSAKSLGRAVRQLSQKHGRPVSCDHTSVSRWLAGTMPRESTAELIVQVLNARLGRVLTIAEVGFAGYDGEGLVHAFEGCDETVGPGAVEMLWSSDLRDIRTLVHSSVVTGAWSDAALTWLVRTDKQPSRAIDVRIGRSDVDAVRATVGMFAALDGTYGGAHARRALIQFLESGLLPLLKTSGRPGDDSGLYQATAEALLLAAWMTYDAGLQGLAQRYFLQALHFADLAGDRLLGANILDAMSHQATFLGRLHDAANLACAARSGSRGVSTPSLDAHFASMEARAYAAAGDGKRAEQSLIRAAQAFEHRNEGADPKWFDYFDEVELNAELGHCFRDIGLSRKAVAHADQGLSGFSARSDFFVKLVKAKAYLRRCPDQGVDLEAACETVREALFSADGLKSARCIAYVRDFRGSLAPYARETAVRNLEEAASTSSIWIDSRAAGP